ncbi:MAG: hypothetical protein Q4F95_08345 [Oscillospiraceae bacterium]|nr:hypothetical protein [Oscillospiraceae bacterium]
MDLNDIMGMMGSMPGVADKANEMLAGGFDFSAFISDDFVREYTDFSSAKDMIDNCGFSVKSLDDIMSISPDKLNAFVKEHTKFESPQQMIDAVTAQLFSK